MKVATDVSARHRLNDLSPGVERTFWRLYELAGREGSRGELPARSVRRLSQLTQIPRATMHRHLRELRSRTLIVGSGLFSPFIMVPLHDLEKTTPARKHDDGTSTDPGVDNLQLFDEGVPLPSVRGPTGGTPSPLENFSLSRDERTSASFSTSQDEGLHPELLEALGSNVFYALDKLYRRHGWTFITTPHEARQIVRMAAADRGGLFMALQQALETYEPGFSGKPILNPPAWLGRTWKAVAGERSVAGEA